MPEQVIFQPRTACANQATIQYLKKLASRVTQTDVGCWEWTGPKVGIGYGRVDLNGKKHLVHRLVYCLCVGVVSQHEEVCHNCPGGDNPACCNPAHLWKGTHTDNMRDSETKGRNSHPGQRGSEHSQAKLTEDDVREIRDRAASGGWGIKTKLAREKGVSKACISEVLSGKKWSHVI